MTRPNPMSPRVRRASAGVAMAAAAVLISGCSELSQQTTTLQYDAADGVSAKVGSVELVDVLLVTPGAGKPAKLSGVATNTSDKAVELTISAGENGGGRKVSIPAGQSVRLDGKTSGNSTATAGPVSFTRLKGAPGDTTTLTFTDAAAGAVNVDAPMLLNQYPYGDAEVTHPTGATPTDAEHEGGGH